MMGDEPVSIHLSVRASTHLFTLSNLNISETSGPIAIQFDLKYNWGGGKVALSFRVTMLKILLAL